MIRLPFMLVLCVICQTSLLAAEQSCRATEQLRLRVRFADETPREVLLESVLPSGFRVLDAASGKELWSGGPSLGHTQIFVSMDAGFGTSIAALQLDSDDVHDRLYAGDHAGRLWRLDLHAGAQPAAWMQATVIAELGVPGGGRGFVAKPDIARIETPAGKSWLNIAIGTAGTGIARNDHRLYVLRDSIAGPPQPPVVESDLEPLSPPAGVSRGNTHGYYLPLGRAQVLAQTLTLNGLIHFTAVESTRSLLNGCASIAEPDAAVPLSITVLNAADGAVSAAGAGNDAAHDLRRLLAGAYPATTAVTLAARPESADGRLSCLIGKTKLPSCFLDTRPHRSWWRREDAD